MNRSSMVVRLARCFQRLPLSWLRVLEAPFVHLSRRAPQEPPMIILLALPRSGSTLTYQCLVHGLGATYLSNLWNMLFAVPLFGGILSRLKCSSHESGFQSQHGFVDGLCGPAEGLKFWSYWFGHGLREADRGGERLGRFDRRIRYIKRVLSIVASTQKPFVGGYLGHALVTGELATMFPNAVFVRLTRDPLQNALSILEMRRRAPSTGFSVTPAECDPLVDASLHRQVASQVYFLNLRIDQALAPDRTIRVSYEDICQDPAREMRRISEFVNSRGMGVRLRKSLPSSFNRAAGGESDAEDARLLASELKALAESGIHEGVLK